MTAARDSDAGKKMSKKFELADLFARPMADVPVSVGTVFLYGLTAADLKAEESKEKAPEERARHFLHRIGSFHKRESFKEDLPPLPGETIAALTEEDITRIADVLREAFPRSHLKADGEKRAVPEEGKREGESGLAYLDRVVQAEIEFQRAAMREVWERAQSLTGSAGKAFKDLRGSADNLERIVRDAQSAVAAPKFKEVRVDTAPIDAMLQAEQRRRAERDEEREWNRLTLQMNTQSAEMLAQLVNTAGTMMVRWNERDDKADKQVKVQLWIAVVALVASTFLSALSTYYGYFTKVAYEREMAQEKADEAAARGVAERDDRIARLLEQNALLLQQNAALIGRAQPNGSPRSRPDAAAVRP